MLEVNIVITAFFFFKAQTDEVNLSIFWAFLTGFRSFQVASLSANALISFRTTLQVYLESAINTEFPCGVSYGLVFFKNPVEITRLELPTRQFLLLILDPIWGHPERKEVDFDIVVGSHPQTLLHVNY